MKLFPDIKITDEDRKRLEETKILRSWRYAHRSLIKYKPTSTDLKKLILIELERVSPRENIIEKLVVRLKKREQQMLFAKINSIIASK